jgi:transposase-like protein
VKRRPTQEFKDRVVQKYLSGTESSREVAAVEGINAGTLRQLSRHRGSLLLRCEAPSSSPYCPFSPAH